MLLKNFRIALAWAVAIRLHICRMHAVIRVEDREREGAHNVQARRGCIIAVNIPRSPRAFGHAAQFQAWCVTLEEEHQIFREHSERAFIRPVWRTVYLKVGGKLS